MVPVKRVSLGAAPAPSLYPEPSSAYPEPPTSFKQSNVSLDSGWKLGAVQHAGGNNSARPGITTGIPVSQVMHRMSSGSSYDSLPRPSYGQLQENYAIN